LVLNQRPLLLLIEVAPRKVESAAVLALLGQTQADEARPVLDAEFPAIANAVMPVENVTRLVILDRNQDTTPRNIGFQLSIVLQRERSHQLERVRRHGRSRSIRALMSSTRQVVIRGPSFTGWGKRPSFTPAHHVDLLTGISPCGSKIVSNGSASDRRGVSIGPRWRPFAGKKLQYVWIC
jgi:hypothetical protein